jgi:hypothetical protein
MVDNASLEVTELDDKGERTALDELAVLAVLQDRHRGRSIPGRTIQDIGPKAVSFSFSRLAPAPSY